MLVEKSNGKPLMVEIHHRGRAYDLEKSHASRFSVPDIKHLGWVCEHTAFVAISYTPNGFERSDGSMTGLAIVRKGDRRS